MSNQGILYVVATPIGNLKDITLRALETLKDSDVILCEDTRVGKRLLKHFNIDGPKLLRYDEHVESKIIPEVKNFLSKGLKVSLISNAGTPCISDPGYRLVRSLREEGFSVIPIPGPSALIAGLSVSGCATDSFVFIGFLPRKEGKRLKLFKEWEEETKTIIFYESPERVIRTIEELKRFEKLRERFIFIGREMTKFYEDYVFMRLGDLDISAIKTKGEFVVILEGKK